MISIEYIIDIIPMIEYRLINSPRLKYFKNNCLHNALIRLKSFIKEKEKEVV